MNIKLTVYTISTLGFLQPIMVQAVDWVITPGVEIAETYLSNVTLVDNNEIEDFVTEVNPSLRISRNSRRLTVLANYKMQNTLYADESDYNDTYHQFQGFMNANLIKDVFFVDLNGTYGQQNIDALGPMATSNLNITGNRSNVTSARIKPYVDYNIKRLANVNAGVEYGTVRYDGGLRDSDLTLYNFDLTSGPKFNRLGWSANFYRNEIDYDLQPDSRLQQTSGTLTYQITRQINLLATSGYDDNDFGTGLLITDGTSGYFWSVGAQWQPSSLTFLEVKVGERYFGNTGSLLFTKRGRRTNLSFSYLEDITVSSNNQFGLNLNPSTDQFGNPITPGLPANNDPSQQNGAINTDISDATISSEFYIRKRLQAGLQFNGGKLTINANAFGEDRDYQLSGNTETVTGAFGSVSWRMSSRTTGVLTTNWTNREFGGSTREDDIYDVRLYVTHLLRKNLTGLVGYGYLERDSNLTGVDYKQHAGRVSVKWTYR